MLAELRERDARVGSECRHERETAGPRAQLTGSAFSAGPAVINSSSRVQVLLKLGGGRGIHRVADRLYLLRLLLAQEVG